MEGTNIMYFFGIDLGTSSVKVLVTNKKNEIIGESSREYPVSYPKENWAEQNPIDWWEQTVGAIHDVIDKYSIPTDKISAISFSGQMHGLVALDENNEVLTPAILWCDQRTSAECDDITNHFGSKKLSELTGNKALTGFTAPKILWLKKHKPEIFNKIAHILLPKDYIQFRLTGKYTTDVSDASGMLLLDVKNRSWSKDMLAYIGITGEMLPTLHESYEVTGTIQPSAMKELGITGETLVIAGAGDQAAGAIGTGTVEEGIVSITLGTSGVVFASHNDYIHDDKNRLHAFCHANGSYHSMGVMLSAASALKWWVDSIQESMTFDDILAEAAETDVASSVYFLPYLMGERTPYANPNAKGVFAGMSMNTPRGILTRAVLEGVSFGLKDSLDILEDTGMKPQAIRIIGGGTKSTLWKQTLADILGYSLQEINTAQGGALGAAILAMVGAKHFDTVTDGCNTMIHVVHTVKANPDMKAYYDKKHMQFSSLYEQLVPWFDSLA